LETIKKHFRVDRKKISFLQFILEAYDGIANLTTIDSASGHVVLNIAPGCENDVKTLLREIENDAPNKPIEQVRKDEGCQKHY